MLSHAYIDKSCAKWVVLSDTINENTSVWRSVQGNLMVELTIDHHAAKILNVWMALLEPGSSLENYRISYVLRPLDYHIRKYAAAAQEITNHLRNNLSKG